jgi:aryl-alcohol dehydrogenase-like predicted oxidoreductase
MKRALGQTGFAVPPLGLALRAARIAMVSGEFSAVIETLLADAIASGCELMSLDLPQARGDVASGNANGPLDAATTDLCLWLGDAIRTARASDHIVTAVTLAPVRSSALRMAFPIGFVQQRVEQVLSATGLDALPLVNLRIDNEQQASDSYWPELDGAMTRMVREGKVLHWGVAAPAPADVDDEIDDQESDQPKPRDAEPDFFSQGRIASVSVPYHLFCQRASRWFASAIERKQAIIVTEPLCLGVLAGEIGVGTLFHRLDPRAQRWSADDLERIAVAVARMTTATKEIPPAARSSESSRSVLEQMQSARSRGDIKHEPAASTILELALRFVLQSPVTAVVGARTREQWRAALATGSKPLDASLYDALRN